MCYKTRWAALARARVVRAQSQGDGALWSSAFAAIAAVAAAAAVHSRPRTLAGHFGRVYVRCIVVVMQRMRRRGVFLAASVNSRVPEKTREGCFFSVYHCSARMEGLRLILKRKSDDDEGTGEHVSRVRRELKIGRHMYSRYTLRHSSHFAQWRECRQRLSNAGTGSRGRRSELTTSQHCMLGWRADC